MQRAFRFPNTPHGVTFRHIRAYAVSPTHSQGKFSCQPVGRKDPPDFTGPAFSDLGFYLDLRARLMVDVKTALKVKGELRHLCLRHISVSK